MGEGGEGRWEGGEGTWEGGEGMQSRGNACGADMAWLPSSGLHQGGLTQYPLYGRMRRQPLSVWPCRNDDRPASSTPGALAGVLSGRGGGELPGLRTLVGPIEDPDVSCKLDVAYIGFSILISP